MGVLQYAAEQGKAVAQWKRGRMYATGEGVPRCSMLFKGAGVPHSLEGDFPMLDTFEWPKWPALHQGALFADARSPVDRPKSPLGGNRN
jgi:hypothetical protein